MSVQSGVATFSAYRLTVRGQVQSVGFRPFVYQLAKAMHLTGCVYNNGVGAVIELSCTAEALAEFQHRLHAELPAIASIDSCSVEAFVPPNPFSGFTIAETESNVMDGQVMPDLAVCPDCLHELFDPKNPRYRYPLINCTYCGPRYSIVRRLPYDRPHTTMADYPLCGRCDAEYRDPVDRRFHAQPIACEDCGPTVKLCDSAGRPIGGRNLFAEAADVLRDGGIVAMKGIGGYHLVCDAQNFAAVERLRARKHRPEKPLAIMALNQNSLYPLVHFTDHGLATLKSPQAPLVIFRSKHSELISPQIAPGMNRLGVMLPYTPMHYLLFHALMGEPLGYNWLSDASPVYLVMTSANISGEPIIADDEQALRDLADIADAFLYHERKIHMRNDDAIVEATGNKNLIVRRGRGMAPSKVVLNETLPRALAFGAELKNTVCLTKNNQAYVSQFIGDLDCLDNRRYLQETEHHLQQVLSVEAQLVACDCHPEFFSTQAAENFSVQQRKPLFRVQHHHAHAASVLAEHQLNEPALAVILDGFGLSEDGQLWGGELLYLPEVSRARHIGSFAPLSLPGGDVSAREGWRIAAAWLHQHDRWPEAQQRFAMHPQVTLLPQMLDRQLNCPTTSSAGRLFDCAAALLDISDHNGFESQSAMLLQATAERYLQEFQLPQSDNLNRYFALSSEGQLDFTVLLDELTHCAPGPGAALFHKVLAQSIAFWVIQAAEQQQCQTVMLSGGCWLNSLLLDDVNALLAAQAVRVYHNEQTPLNDGNISLGQAYVAAHRFNQQQ